MLLYLHSKFNIWKYNQKVLISLLPAPFTSSCQNMCLSKFSEWFNVNDPLTEVVGEVFVVLYGDHRKRVTIEGCCVLLLEKLENTKLLLNYIQNLCWLNYQANIHSTHLNLNISHHSGNCANTTYTSSAKGQFRLQGRSAPVGQKFPPKAKTIFWGNGWYGGQDGEK